MGQVHSAIPTSPQWVESTAELNALCERWQSQGSIALDTEFIRTDTYYPKPALYQVGDGRGCYLLDPLRISDFSSFVALLQNPNVVKVMHSCSEDLEVFRCAFDVIPAPLFDTQIAAPFTGREASMGYARLVEDQLNIAMTKSETRSDWLQRPLSVAQLNYAALDVAYLLVIYGMQRQQLQALSRWSWVQEDCQRILDQAANEPSDDEWYLRIKSAWRLKPRELAVLRALAAWREAAARARNVPRNRLIKEAILLEMAQHPPRYTGEIHRFKGIPARVLKADADDIMAHIQHALALPDDALPPLVPAPPSPSQMPMMKRLKVLQQETAASLNMPAEVLMRRRDMELLIRAKTHDEVRQCWPAYSGWRGEVFGARLLDCLGVKA